MNQINLEQILLSELKLSRLEIAERGLAVFAIERAIQEACNQAIDLCAENAKLNHNYYDKDEERDLYNEHKDFGLERCDGDGIPYGVDVIVLNKESILNTKKQII